MLAAIGAILGLAVAGCGGGSMSEEEVAAKVEAACTKLSGYSVWLPEHLEKTGKSTDAAEGIMKRAGDEFSSSLDSLDPPGDLREPIERLARQPDESPTTRGALEATLRREEGLYDEIGADRCSRAIKASSLSLDGASVTDAYERVGLPLPPHPAGW